MSENDIKEKDDLRNTLLISLMFPSPILEGNV